MLLCTFRTDRTSEYRIEHSEINKSYPSEIKENINDGLYEIEMAYEQNRNGIVLQGLFNLEGRMLYKECCKNDVGDNVGDRFLMLLKYFRSWFHLQKIFFHQT